MSRIIIGMSACGVMFMTEESIISSFMYLRDEKESSNCTWGNILLVGKRHWFRVGVCINTAARNILINLHD